MQRHKKIIIAALAAMDADGIAQSQTPGAAGNLTLNGALASGGVATLDVARRVMIVCAGNNSGVTFTITGTNAIGDTISETITGPNTTSVSSLKDYKTVTGVAISAASTGAVTIGTTDGTTAGASTPVMSSPWVPQDRSTFSIGIGCIKTGTINYSIQHTQDDPFSARNPNPTIDTYLTPFDHQSLNNKAANADGSYDFAVRAVRATINSYVASATLTVFVNPNG